MNRTRILVAAALTSLLLMGWVGIAHAQSFRHGSNVTVAQGQVVNQTLYAWGNTINIAGTVNGDVICAGQDVTVTGTVNGDVICAGQNVHISGHVTGNIRLAGQDLSISSLVDHNLSALGQNVTIESNGQINTDASIGGQDVTLNGNVGRDLAVAANSVNINGKVGRNVQSADTHLSLGSTANVTGNITYTSSNMLSQAGSAHVGGTVTQKQPTRSNERTHYGAFFHGGLWFAFYLLIAGLIAALVLVLLFPQLFHVSTDVAIHRPGRTFLIGLGTAIAAPVIIGILLISIVGIPLGILALLTWLVVLLLSGPFAAYYTGRLLMLKSTNAVLIMLVGGLVLLVLYFVPFLGTLVTFVAACFGLGIIATRIKDLPKPNYQVVPVHREQQKKAKNNQ
jgi:cytoskeletal protein CcmA (bactofilin family)